MVFDIVVWPASTFGNHLYPGQTNDKNDIVFDRFIIDLER